MGEGEWQRTRYLKMQVQTICLSALSELGIRRGLIKFFLWSCSMLQSMDKKT